MKGGKQQTKLNTPKNDLRSNSDDERELIRKRSFSKGSAGVLILRDISKRASSCCEDWITPSQQAKLSLLNRSMRISTARLRASNSGRNGSPGPHAGADAGVKDSHDCMLDLESLV